MPVPYTRTVCQWMLKAPKESPKELTNEIIYNDDEEKTKKIIKLAQDYVGGYVEMVALSNTVALLVDEDGMAKNLPQNCGYLGNLLFVGEDWGTLSEEDMRKIKKWISIHSNDVHRTFGPNLVVGDEAISEALQDIRQSRLKDQEAWRNL